jgi:hypothetical protein
MKSYLPNRQFDFARDGIGIVTVMSASSQATIPGLLP